MAASITHLVVGERVFRQIPHFNSRQAVRGSFLLGCVLVDVHVFHDISRRQTHFVGRFEEGRDSQSQSCSNFLKQRDALLRRPWNSLRPDERAFVMGYLCHLAVDECWKDQGWRLVQELEISSWIDLPVPFDVLLTAFDFLSRKELIDPETTFAALLSTTVPDTFGHILYETWRHQWDIVREYVMSDGTPGAYIKMLGDADKPEDKIQEAKRQHDVYWEDAINLFNGMGGVMPFLQTAAAKTIDVIPISWIGTLDSDAANASTGR